MEKRKRAPDIIQLLLRAKKKRVGFPLQFGRLVLASRDLVRMKNTKKGTQVDCSKGKWWGGRYKMDDALKWGGRSGERIL